MLQKGRLANVWSAAPILGFPLDATFWSVLSLGDNRSFAWLPTAPVIEALRDSQLGRLTLQFTGAIGQVYLVQTSTNLIEWMTAGGALDLQNGGFSFGEAVTPGQRFYRVLLP